MSFPGFLLSAWYDIVGGARMTRGQAGIDAFRAYLNNGANQTIRFYIAGTTGYGHQASSANLMRRLCQPNAGVSPGYVYTGTIEAYIDASAGNRPYAETLAKMLRLLPELGAPVGGVYPFINGAHVQFAPYPAAPPAAAVNLGFTGGADAANQYATALNVGYFLRLQPYRWTLGENELQFRGRSAAITLDNQQALGYHMFVERAYVQPIVPPNWDAYANNQQAQIANWLTQPAQTARFNLAPIYSIRYPAVCELKSADQRLTVILAAVLAAQQNGLPAIVVNLDVYDADVGQNQYGLQTIAAHLAGGAFPLDEFYPARATARQAAFAPLNAANRFDYLIYDQALPNNLATLQAKVQNWLTAPPAGRVLYLQLARAGATIPPDIFAYMFSQATLPTVFEGQNTANLSLNLGVPYFHANRPSTIGTEQYPGDILSEHGGSAIGIELQGIADQILTDFTAWPLAPPNPLTVIPTFIANRNQQKYADYFTGMRTFYRQPLEDKFNLSATFLNYAINGVANLEALIRDAAAADGDTLDSIYQAFSAAIQNNKTVVFRNQLDASSKIATFIADVEKQFAVFVTDDTAVTKDPQTGAATTVTVTGTTTMFGSGLTVAVAAEFTAPDGVVTLNCSFTGDVAWRPDGVPWIGFGDPYVQFSVADADLPVAGKVGGQLIGPDIDFYAVLPPNNGALLFTGNFVSPPSIDKLFQLAGGVNIVSSLPSPLNILAQLELTQIEIGTQSSGDPLSFGIEYFFFQLDWKASGNGWELLPNVTLDELGIGINLPVPGSTNELKANITGEFLIGTGDDAAHIAVNVKAPNLSYQAQLTSGVVKLTDLLEIFLPFVTLDPPSQPEITQFSMAGVQKTGDFSVTCQLGFDWKIPSDDLALLELQNIGLMANRVGGVTTGQLTGSVTILPNDSKNALGLDLTAAYLGKDDGWKFSAQQSSDDQQLSLISLMATYLGGWTPPQDYGINGIHFSTTPSKHTYSFGGKTAEPWSLPFMDSLTVSASMELAYDPALTPSPYSGNLAATVNWSDWSLMTIDLACVFGAGKYTYTIDWRALHAEIAQNESEQWVAKGTLSGLTLGGIVEDLISFATGSRFGLGAPWNLLDSVSLDNLELDFNFTTKVIGFAVNIGSIDLGFCSIKGITVSYDGSSSKSKVQVTLDGTFPWTTEAPSWNATNPDETPAPPGGGNEYLDLRLLALGQHVAIQGAPQFTSVKQAIDAMRNMDSDGAPITGPNDNIVFDSNSSWLIGADMGLMKIKSGESSSQLDDDDSSGYVVNLSIVFNDPDLYGARIVLAGPAAKILDGLAFEILYRKISDNIGVYQIDLTLPDKMRKFDVGAYSLTLPSLALDIYTNGDFTFDLGFPWNEDFSNSFMVQGIVPPGIPVLGAGGFYFGKLSSETSTQVPVVTNGRFQPVIIFGFGANVGVGKSVDYGILKAGISITVFGIIQGVVAKWCPYPSAPNLPADQGQLQDGYYFELDGTFGIIGLLYGSVDFVIIKASVSVTIKVMVQITYISYQDVPITLLASVDVTASLSIDLGFFSITVHFSFSMTLKETFTIQNPNKNPPWQVASDSRAARLAAAHRRGLSAANVRRHLLALDDNVTFTWNNLGATTPPQPLTGYWGPSLTASGDMASTPAAQQACFVNMLAIASSDPTVPRKPTDPDTSFDLLAQQVFRWIVAAAQPPAGAPYSANDVDTNILVTPDDLCALLCALNDPTNPMPIPADAIDAFMTSQFTLNATLPASGTYDAAPFPVSPKLALDVPAYGSSAALHYSFAEFNSASSAYLDTLRTYFDDLTVQVEKETPTLKTFATMDVGLSVATFVFADYFRLIGKQMIEAARDALRSYKYPLANGASIGSAVAWIGAAGAPEITAADVLDANGSHAFSANQAVLIYGAASQVGTNASFTSIATTYGDLFTPELLATANAAASGLLVTGATVVYQGTSYTVDAGSSLNDLVAKIGVTLADLFANAPAVLSQTGLLVNGAAMTVPGGATATAAESATFTTIAGLYRTLFTPTALATANAASINLLAPNAKVSFPGSPQPYPIQARDTLNTVAAHFGVSLTVFLQQAPGVLAQPGLIATFAQLALPDFTYTTATGDTPSGIAQLFGVTAVALATPANNAVTFDASSTATLDIPHLAQLKVGALIDEIKRTNGLSRIGGMTGRYSLHGLRLPTAGLTQTYPCTCGSTATDCGLYALTGQQFAVPPLGPDKFLFSLQLPAGPFWISFGGPSLTMTLDLANDTGLNYAKTKALQTFFASANYRVAPPGTVVEAEQIYRDQPTTWPATNVIPWQSAGSVTLPYGTAPTGVQALRLWGLSTSLLNLGDVDRAAPPRANAVRGTYDEGSGQTVETDLIYRGWATRVSFTVKQMTADPAFPGSAFTYQLMGCGEADIQLLERMLTALSGDSSTIQSLTLLYPPDASTSAPAGLLSDNGGTVTIGLTQANLSTVTNPPNSAAALLAAQPTFAGCLNTPYDFVKLLWECSITRSGGFYLYYFDSASGSSFPGNIFNDKGEASLTLLAMYKKPDDVSKQDLIAGYVNCLVTGDAFDVTKSTVYAKSNPIAVSYTCIAGDSLASIAYSYYMDPIALAEANPDATLTPNAQLNLARGIYQVNTAAPAGDSAAIASYFATTLTLLQAANPQISNWNQALPLYTVLRLPVLQLAIGTNPGGATLSSIAAYYGTSIAEIAADNATARGLLANQPLAVPGGPMSRSATVPAGCIGLAATRTPPLPVPAPTDSSFARLYIENQIVLLGYRMFSNTWFKVTNPGLPISHSNEPDSAVAADRTRTPRAFSANDSTPWTYQRAIPAARNAVLLTQQISGLPDPADSPYAGVGGIAQISLGWVDVFGNTVISDLGDGASAPATLPLPVNFIDALLGVEKWPSVAVDYCVLVPPNAGAGPTLLLDLNFDPNPYSPDPNEPQTNPPAWQVRAGHALVVYNQVYQQLSQMVGPAANQSPAVTIAIGTSLLPGTDLTLDATARGVLMTWLFGANGVYPFLVARSNGDTTSPAPAACPIDIPFALTAVNSDQLFELTTTVTLSRPATLVDPAFADTPGFVTTTTAISAQMVQDSNGSYTLGTFANQLQSCVSQAGVCSYMLATGVDRARVAQPGAAKPLWLARLGLVPAQAISFQIANNANPLIYAPRPLYNTLQSRPSVPYYNYVSGVGIDFATPSGNQALTGIDVDGWMRQFLAAVDTIFSPEFLTPVALVDQLATVRPATSWQEQLRTAKQLLAASLSGLVTPFFDDESPDGDQLDAAQEAFAQQALVALSNVYAVNAVIQFGATVNADINDDEESTPPQLYGNFLPLTDSDSGASLTSAKLNLASTATGKTTPLTFLVSATGKNAQGFVESSVTLDLIYRGSQIEHQISPLPNIENYTASSWLSFVTPIPPPPQNDPTATGWPLDAYLGKFTVPLPLRVFPTPPTMVVQDAITHPVSDPVDWQKIVEALEWDYAFTYSESFHYPQDQTHFTTDFNVVDSVARRMAVPTDPVPDLFEFIMVYPQVQTDLNGVLAAITQGSSQTNIDHAAVALDALVALIKRAASSLASFLQPVTGSDKALVGAALRGIAPYTYAITETVTQKTNPDNLPVSALLVGLTPAPPTGIAAPSVDIDGYVTAANDPPPNFTYGFCYTDTPPQPPPPPPPPPPQDYLTAAKGQAIPGRTVTLPGLNILAAQSARTSGYIERNQDIDPTRKTADVFVYKTATVAFPSALRPTIDVPNAIDIASFGGNSPVARAFADQLANLFGVLFANAPAGPQTIQLSVGYTIAFNSDFPDAATLPLPILFLPPTKFQPMTAEIAATPAFEDEPMTQDALIAALRAGVYAWCDTRQPPAGGDLQFNLTVMTSLQSAELSPMPLLVLEKLTLHYADWTDHPNLAPQRAEAAE